MCEKYLCFIIFYYDIAISNYYWFCSFIICECLPLKLIQTWFQTLWPLSTWVSALYWVMECKVLFRVINVRHGLWLFCNLKTLWSYQWRQGNFFPVLGFYLTIWFLFLPQDTYDLSCWKQRKNPIPAFLFGLCLLALIYVIIITPFSG